MNKEERREYHKRWRDNTDREKFLAGQRRRHRKWYYAHLEEARAKARISTKKHRDKDPDKTRAYVRERWLIQSHRNRRFILGYKLASGCVDCGQSNPIVLDFDHIRGKKVLRLANMVKAGWSLLTIVKEIEKCEVRCSNCHRIRHNRRTGE